MYAMAVVAMLVTGNSLGTWKVTMQVGYEPPKVVRISKDTRVRHAGWVCDFLLGVQPTEVQVACSHISDPTVPGAAVTAISDNLLAARVAFEDPDLGIMRVGIKKVRK